MATIFTHGLVGLAMAPLAPKAIPKRRLWLALALLPMIPDLDVLAFSLGIPYAHPLGHRGFTHSLLFAALLGYFVAWLLSRGRSISGLARVWLGLLLSLALASHGLLDALTDAGHGVAFFWPFDNHRYFFPFRPLATSPIGIPAFLNGEVLPIFANEARWVWTPLVLVFVSLLGLRAWFQRFGSRN